jgi:two-component system, NtrC family, nitrogen regulation response regulator NtrX
MKVLIIDDEINICLSLKNILEDEGHECIYISEGKKALKAFADFNPDVILLDVRLDTMNGIDLLKKFKEADPEINVIMISGHSGIKEAVKSIKAGAYDFMEKPLSLSKVKITVKNAHEFKQIKKDYKRLKKDVSQKFKIIGKSKSISELKEMIQRVAPGNSKVLIRGESGTGKELVAYAIYNQSSRSDKPFVKFNSAAIPTELVESELFGFEKGAFTGAVKSKDGKIESAHGGTLFLDEIGDMSLKAQAKILRVIQEGEFERVGSNKTNKIDVRLIAATNKNLEAMVKCGEFREDLYYRLNVIPLFTSPLREHPEDIPVLTEYFCDFFRSDLNLPNTTLSDEVIKYLQKYEFRGNVRELRNLIERLFIMTGKKTISLEDLTAIHQNPQSTDFWNETKQYKIKKREFEIKYLTAQLRLNNGSLTETAEALSLQVSNLSRKIKELNIN